MQFLLSLCFIGTTSVIFLKYIKLTRTLRKLFCFHLCVVAYFYIIDNWILMVLSHEYLYIQRNSNERHPVEPTYVVQRVVLVIVSKGMYVCCCCLLRLFNNKKLMNMSMSFAPGGWLLLRVIVFLFLDDTKKSIDKQKKKNKKKMFFFTQAMNCKR